MAALRTARVGEFMRAAQAPIAALIAAAIAALPAPTFAKGGKSSAGNARSAVSGKYVTKGYAAKNPKTTVVEKRK